MRRTVSESALGGNHNGKELGIFCTESSDQGHASGGSLRFPKGPMLGSSCQSYRSKWGNCSFTSKTCQEREDRLARWLSRLTLTARAQ